MTERDAPPEALVRHDWSEREVRELLSMPFNDLVFRAQTVHRRFFPANEVQVSTLCSIKTGACPEDCKYCPQSVAYRSPKPKQLAVIKEMVRQVNALGMETCATLGMISAEQAAELKEAGLDYYNHNLDTSENFYGEIITTRTYKDRLDTLKNVRNAGMKVCCGGIIGMGETTADRAQLLQTLATLPEHPHSVPVNQLVQVPGTPLHGAEPVDPIDLVRTIAVTRILMPRSHVRLSAGRTEMSDETQALAFLAGANSIFYGERLLTTDNPAQDHDRALFEKLGIRPEPPRDNAGGTEAAGVAPAPHARP